MNKKAIITASIIGTLAAAALFIKKMFDEPLIDPEEFAKGLQEDFERIEELL